ncbi:conserved membrane hypothetical protein [Frankia canadensis]|uniref:Flp pilus assembly protein TadB n=1 Tax=Frankia canadensis TaxID=1836972 RepID=A0A2I2L1A4_9ACTN|nr:hypothetical protein [Frankia canadensis]SNQ51690.1 conserved membrane hypothetical protein [Frankia canadensis]SOU58980.1 conserved membrane hypothetical protein [Frankia canadensis]
MNAQLRPLVEALAGALAGLGLWLLLITQLWKRSVGGGRTRSARAGIAAPTRRPDTRPGEVERVRRRPELLWPVAGGGLVGLVLGVAAGVPVLAVVGFGVGALMQDMRREPKVAELNELGEAAATWGETVRQELDAGQPLRAAVLASCQLPPTALAEPLRRLRVCLDREPLPVALADFRAAVPHQLIGEIVTVLSLTYQRGAGDLARLMADQVESTRHRVAVLRDLHAARARYRRSMALILGMFAASVVVVLALWPVMLAPYRTAWGQAIVVLLAGCLGLAMRALLRMSRPGLVPDFFRDEP